MAQPSSSQVFSHPSWGNDWYLSPLLKGSVVYEPIQFGPFSNLEECQKRCLESGAATQTQTGAAGSFALAQQLVAHYENEIDKRGRNFTIAYKKRVAQLI